MFDSQLKNEMDNHGVSGNPKISKKGKSVTLPERSVYIEGVKVLQRQERISYFFTLVISLVLIMLMFVILRLA